MKVYTAGHTHLVHEIYEWKQEIYAQVVSSWLGLVMGEMAETPANSKAFWQNNIKEVQDADVVVVFADPLHPLRGALVEVGVGLAAEIPIIIVGEHPSFGSWRHHPLVYNVAKLADVDEVLRLLDQ
jgi:nucleoside 2-deoxyribosyltransferase